VHLALLAVAWFEVHASNFPALNFGWLDPEICKEFPYFSIVDRRVTYISGLN
jgi:hypothetical protein